MADNETTTQAPAVTEPVIPVQPVEHTVSTVDEAPILAVLQGLTESAPPVADPTAPLTGPTDEPAAEPPGTGPGRDHEPMGNIANGP